MEAVGSLTQEVRSLTVKIEELERIVSDYPQRFERPWH
jgi:hypothetical protein